MRLRLYHNKGKAFTLIEVLVVLAVCSLLMGIIVPVLSTAKKNAYTLKSKNNKREILMGVFNYSSDHDVQFPESVAKIGSQSSWSWSEPTVLAGFQKRTPSSYRSVSQYLRSYIESSSTMFCPCSPSKYPFAQQAWEAGDAWDHPESATATEDPLFGDYCLYWNYIGYLEEAERTFVGPRSAAKGRYESQLLISDYFGYGHWRNELAYNSRQAYGSCERFEGCSVTPGTSVSCDFWSLFNRDGGISLDSIKINLSAGFIDGHVETYTPADVTGMKISMKPDGSKPYPDQINTGGIFYIPKNY